MVGLRALRGDVLYVGSAELPELAELEHAGLTVERRTSLVDAIARLREQPIAVTIVHVGSVGARDGARLAALREAGATAVVGVYAASIAWRAGRTSQDGVDVSIALPAAPGALFAATSRLVSSRPRSEPVAAVAAAPAPAPPAVELAPSRTVPVVASPPRPTPQVRTSWLEGVVADISTMNRALDNVDRLLDHVLASFLRRADVERCSVLLYDRRRTELRVRRTTIPQDVGSTQAAAPADSLAAHAARSGRPVLVADIASPPAECAGFVPAPGRSYRTRSCLLLPLLGAEEVIGVVCLADRKGGRAFRDADVAPLEFLSAQTGQAIENALRFRQFQELAAIDELTGLANRRHFQEALEREVQRAKRYERQVSLAILDLDHFKSYNDLCGHQAGDQALAAIGEILRTSLREVDVVARYGGEEFAVILPETSARPSGTSRTPFPFLERLRRRIEEASFPGEEKIPGGKLTISGGVSCFPDDAVTLDEMIREADRALYVSKARGRNTITYRGKTLSE